MQEITKQHVLDAVSQIEREGISLNPSISYDVLINGEPYPPKDIMRYANLLANGHKEWKYSGGESTNRFLRDMGFEIVDKHDVFDLETGKESLITSLQKSGEENARFFFKCAKRLLDGLGVEQGDERITNGTRGGDRLSITVGQRYCLAFIPKDNQPWQFIQEQVSDNTEHLKVEPYNGSPEAYYYCSQRMEDLENRMDGIISASKTELDRATLSSYRRYNNPVFERAILDANFRKEIFGEAFGEDCPLTGRVWKMGCNWGGGKNPSYYDMLKSRSLVICASDRLYKMGDLILAMEGFVVKALRKVLESPKPVTDEPEFKGVFPEYHIPHESWVMYAKAEWYELPAEDRFEYKLQQGIRKVNKKSAKDKAFDLWNNRHTNHWIFQCNPDHFDLEGAVREGALRDWTVTAHKDKIKRRDKVILWLTGKARGCYALAEVTAPPTAKDASPDDSFWKTNPKASLKAGIRLTHDLTKHPLLWKDIKDSEGLEGLKAGSQGTNFSATRQQYETLLQLAEKNTIAMIEQPIDLSINTILYGPPGTGKTYRLNEYRKDFFTDRSAAEPGKVLKERFKFITFHQKYSYEDFIEGIKPLLRNGDEGEGGEQGSHLQFELKKGLFYESCLAALRLAGYASFEECHEDSSENRTQAFEAIKGDPHKQFALFIDEINRANISAVFGELITLLEHDKRIGQDREMWLELPYSNEKFCVPSNLYVIGTMNTADRSIALLDIALRRRFEFKALYPLYTEGEWWSPLLEKLNQAIYDWKKNPDFFIGHAFFMNRPESDRSDILNTKIIPLLYEYCQNNADAVSRILSNTGVKTKETGIRENFRIIAE